MDPFKTVSKMSIPTIFYGAFALALSWLIYMVGNPFLRLQLGEAALVFLSLFFYSLISDKISEIEENMKVLSQGRRETKAKLVP